MGLFIRIDVDKPYGHKNLFYKVISKINEDFFSIYLSRTYLNGTISLLKFLNKNKIESNIYFRNCTSPNPEVLKLLKEGNHSVGFHAENTKSKKTFLEELNTFKKKITININHFTKHGSGKLKLGKNHYPLYEPKKYLKWSREMKLTYKFGNGTLKNEISDDNEFIPNMFWAESWYRTGKFNSIDTLIEKSKEKDYVFLIHPSNYETHQKVKKDLEYLIQQVKEKNLEIKTI